MAYVNCPRGGKVNTMIKLRNITTELFKKHERKVPAREPSSSRSRMDRNMDDSLENDNKDSDSGRSCSSACSTPYSPGRPKEYRASDPLKNVPPKDPGEYRIMDKDRNIKYIGETNNLERRRKEHRRTGKLQNEDVFAWKTASKDSTSDTRREHERKKIKQHKPPLNKSRGGEGRKAV